VVACVFILLCSLIREPDRQRFSALMISGAGAAYLGGGLGAWEVLVQISRLSKMNVWMPESSGA
jgi:hypothetical protein